MKTRKTLVMVIALAVAALTATGIIAYAAWYAGVTKNAGNKITTGSTVSYTLTGDLNGTGLMPGGTVTQTLTIGLSGDAAGATLAVISMTATGSDEQVVEGISTWLTYELLDDQDADVDMEDITADGTYKLVFTLDGNTPDAFTDCEITYTLTLMSNTLS